MLKKLVLFAFILLVLPTILSIDLNIEYIDSKNVIVHELDNSVIFDLQITNNEATKTFEIYNLLGFSMSPQRIELKKDEKTNVQIKVTPPTSFSQEGLYIFNYYFGEGSEELSQELVFRSLKLKDAFEIGTQSINPESNSIELYIENKENLDFGEVTFELSSAFFEIEKIFILNAKEKESFTIELNKEDFSKLSAGFYTINTKIIVGDVQTNLDSIVKFEEKDILKTTNENYGFLISTNIITKTNEGNTLTNSQTIIEKNMISRLFTSFNPEPDVIERQGTQINYTWNKEINPGESLEIRVRTNWLFPFLVVFLVIALVVLVKKFSQTNLTLKKRVSFVKAKGGEFALKVSIHVHAQKYLEHISIIDKLPPLVKVYEKFGMEKPTIVDEAKKMLRWEFEKLESGEVRVINYIIYSKIGIMGKFALPAATAIFERDGQIQETNSNKAFFIAEQRKEDAI